MAKKLPKGTREIVVHRGEMVCKKCNYINPDAEVAILWDDKTNECVGVSLPYCPHCTKKREQDKQG